MSGVWGPGRSWGEALALLKKLHGAVIKVVTGTDDLQPPFPLRFDQHLLGGAQAFDDAPHVGAHRTVQQVVARADPVHHGGDVTWRFHS